MTTNQVFITSMICFVGSLVLVLARRQGKALDLPASVIEAAGKRFSIPGRVAEGKGPGRPDDGVKPDTGRWWITYE